MIKEKLFTSPTCNFLIYKLRRVTPTLQILRFNEMSCMWPLSKGKHLSLFSITTSIMTYVYEKTVGLL